MNPSGSDKKECWSMDSGKPCCGPHHRRDSVPGANDNEMPLEKCIDAIHSKLTECIDLCLSLIHI